MSQELFMYVTGVVGRAMGSGKFDASHIGILTETALAAFREHLAPELTKGAQAPRPAPSASQGPQRPAWQAGAQAIIAGQGQVQAETKSLTLWGGDKAHIGWKDAQAFGKPEPEVCWGEWLGAAADGDQKAKGLLEKAAAADPYKGDPKWHAMNIRRVARAKACLKLLAEGYGAPPGEGPGSEPTPF